MPTTPPAKVLITFPDGHQERFEVQFYYESMYLPDEVFVNFVPLGDTTSELYVTGDYQLIDHPGSDSIVDQLAENPTAVFNPDSYVLKTQEGAKYYLSRSKGVTAIEEPNGNLLYINRTNLLHSVANQIDIVTSRRIDIVGKSADFPADVAIRSRFDRTNSGRIAGQTSYGSGLPICGRKIRENRVHFDRTKIAGFSELTL